jgi:hypothetical protein
MKLKEYKKAIARMEFELRTRKMRGEDVSGKKLVAITEEKSK